MSLIIFLILATLLISISSAPIIFYCIFFMKKNPKPSKITIPSDKKLDLVTKNLTQAKRKPIIIDDYQALQIEIKNKKNRTPLP